MKSEEVSLGLTGRPEGAAAAVVAQGVALGLASARQFAQTSRKNSYAEETTHAEFLVRADRNSGGAARSLTTMFADVEHFERFDTCVSPARRGGDETLIEMSTSSDPKH